MEHKEKQMKCDTCLNGIAVVSENGIHYNCALSEKKALYCFTGQDDNYIRNPMKKDSEDIK